MGRIEQQHTLQDDEYKKIGEARRILAERFLDTVLLPVVKEEGEITHEKFIELMDNFKLDNPEPGIDLELGHVWIVTFERLLVQGRIAKTNQGRISPEGRLVKKAWELLTPWELEADE